MRPQRAQEPRLLHESAKKKQMDRFRINQRLHFSFQDSDCQEMEPLGLAWVTGPSIGQGVWEVWLTVLLTVVIKRKEMAPQMQSRSPHNYEQAKRYKATTMSKQV